MSVFVNFLLLDICSELLHAVTVQRGGGVCAQQVTHTHSPGAPSVLLLRPQGQSSAIVLEQLCCRTMADLIGGQEATSPDAVPSAACDRRGMCGAPLCGPAPCRSASPVTAEPLA